MTIEKFYETLNFIVKLDANLRLQPNLATITDTLSSLVNSPAQPSFQSALASTLATFTEAAGKLREAISPSQSSSIAEVGGKEFFEPTIAEKIQTSIAANAMTPSVARDFVQDIAARRAKFLTTIKQTLAGLEELGVSSKELGPGDADLAFVIPRDLFDNELGSFAKELSFINHLIQDFSEAVTGEAEPAVLEGLSSSDPTIALVASLPVIAVIAGIVNKFLEAWEKIEKIRKIRAELTDIGMKGKALDELTENITTTVNEVVEESTRVTLEKYKGDLGRRNELESALRRDTRRLFGQIERGLTIQFRAEPSAKADEPDRKALETIERISRTLQFPQIENEPMLLTNGEILEGELEVIKVSKKTTIRKTTTKKDTRRDITQDA
jgi:hypothetical protein